MISANAGSRLISVPKAAVVSRRSASSSSANGNMGSRTASAEPDQQELRCEPVEHVGTDHRGRDQRRHRHRHRETADSRRPGRPPAGSAGCSPPSSTRRPMRTSRRPGRRCPTTAGSSTAPRRRPGRPHMRSRPRPWATATASGPRNSNALAVPIGIRSSAAMYSRVMPAVTTPRPTQVANVRRVNRAARGRSTTRNSSAGPGQPQPGGAVGADPVDQRDRDRDPELHRQHRRHGHERPGAGLTAGHA